MRNSGGNEHLQVCSHSVLGGKHPWINILTHETHPLRTLRP